MIYIVPGLGNKRYNLPKNIKYLRLSIDDVLNLPKLPKDSVLIGFSIGAVIAYLIALKYPVKKLILCSPSPIIVKYKRPKAQIYILSGNKETPQMQKYAAGLTRKLKGTLVKVSSGHKLSRAYIKAIVNVAEQR
ncbi:MAG: alpha/beta hydrolase [Candidatus Yanofskybacteria bacterium]|nr:alpha/beta hydrolase [Candidatus Yanofskybacteria bacterium]